MSRSRDIAKILGVTEADNTSNVALLNTTSSTGLDSSQVSAIAGAEGLTVYATKENLPTTGLTSGDQAFVTDTSRLYISNGSGWYNVALINATPSLTIDPTGAITLAKDGSTPTVITLTATDSDNAVAGLTFSVDSDGSFGGLATVSQDSSVFTITPLSEASATTTTSTLTFKASDGISFGSGQRTLSLTFSTLNSNYTTFLVKADTAGTDNQVDASGSGASITEVGNVTSSAFSPYHPSGYSNYVTNTPNNYAGFVAWDSAPTFSATAWCVETWFKPNGMPSVNVGTNGHWSIFGCWDAYNSNKEFLLLGGTDGKLRFYYSFDGSASGYVDTATGVLQANKWIHLAVSFDGTNYTLYADGVNVARLVNSTQIANKAGPLMFGKSIDGAGNVQTYVDGWYADGRVINGSTLESSNTFPVPTSRIDTSVANTQAVFHNKPHLRQGLIFGNDATVVRAGPYDYIAYSKVEHSGSVYFDGTGDYLGIPDDNGFELDGDFAIECWFYRKSVVSGTYCSIIGGNGSSSNGWNIYITNSNGAISFFHSSFLLTYTEGVKNGVWYHVAVTRSGTDLKLFVNGQERASATNSSTFNQNDANSGTRIGYDINANGYFNGYVTDARVVKGSSVYTTNFLAPTAPLTAISGTQLLTCTNKSDIWDANGQFITKIGSIAASDTYRKFTTSSAIHLNGNDRLTLPISTNANFGTGDFTVEWWQYWVGNQSGYGTIYDNNYNTSPNVLMQTDNNVNKYFVYMNALQKLTESTAANSGEWYHYALVRYNGTVTLYRNGAASGTPFSFTASVGSSATATGIGARTSANSPISNSYIQSFRITKGLARYTSTFTPPTAEFVG